MITTPQTTKTTNNSVIPAPIQSVSLETTRLSGFEEVICSSRDVYPAPRVNLFTEPASLPDSLQPLTRKTADKQGLYSVESKLKKLKDLTYICLVQSFYRSQSWRASLQQKGLISLSYIAFHHCYYYMTLHHQILPWPTKTITCRWENIMYHNVSALFKWHLDTILTNFQINRNIRRGRSGLHHPLCGPMEPAELHTDMVLHQRTQVLNHLHLW